MKLISTGSDVLNLQIVPINLEKRLKNFWMNGSEMKGVSVRNYLKTIKYTNEGLSYRFNCSRVDIERICLRYGIGYIYRLPGVAQIKATRKYLMDNFTELDDIRMIENRFFDLGTCDTQRYDNRFPENDVVACNSLANDLSISKSLIFQLSIMGALLHVDSNIHPRLYNQMAKVVIRFRKELLGWAKKAVDIENYCRKKAVSFHCEEKIPFEDAVGEHVSIDIWDSEDI